MTPLGTALLGRDDGAWPADPAPALLHIAPLPVLSKVEGPALSKVEGVKVPAIILDVPAALPLPDRFALEAIVSPAPVVQGPPSPTRGGGGRTGHYRLTRPRFLRALQRGHTVEGVVNFLERASGEPVPASVLGLLYRWEETFDRLTIRQAVLLQTRDPRLLRDLTAQRRIRQTLGATLNARTVEVRADRLDTLLRRLARRDILPRLDLPSADSPLPLVGEGAELAAIAVALRVHAHLADVLGLATRPAYALARRWCECLALPLRDAVERTVEQTLEALRQAAPLEMEDHLPEPTGPLLKVLEAAIQEHTTVEIEYYTAGRAHRSTRRVEPLRLEWRGDVAYLVAYCHLRGDQRVFRVDRIRRIEDGE